MSWQRFRADRQAGYGRWYTIWLAFCVWTSSSRLVLGQNGVVQLVQGGEFLLIDKVKLRFKISTPFIYLGPLQRSVY